MADVEAALTSRFQRRLVQCDITKMLRTLLATADYDAILLDFIDERFDVLEIANCVATLSSELAATKVQNRAGIVRRGPQDDARFAMWKDGFDELLCIADERNVPVILNRVYWADRDETGSEFNAEAVQRGNTALSAMYAQVPSHVAIVSHERDTMVGDSQHVWGRSPFHFVQPVYQRTIRDLTSMLC